MMYNLLPYFDYLILQIITYFEILKLRTLAFKDISNGELKCNEIDMKSKIGTDFSLQIFFPSPNFN